MTGMVVCLLGSAVAVVPTAFAQDTAEETSVDKGHGAAWLLEPVGARAIALQAYTPLADDGSAISLNPAGLANLEQTGVLIYTRAGSLDLREQYLGVYWPEVGGGTLGVAWRHVGADNSDVAPFIATDSEGNDLGTLDFSGNAFDVAYGYWVNEDVQIGASLGLVFDSFDIPEASAFIDDESESGFRGLTIGIVGNAADVLQYGATLSNLAGSLGDDGSIPVSLRFGVAMEYPGREPVVLAIDFEKQFVDLQESTSQVRMGAEYHLSPVKLRLGTSQSADRSRWFAGFGVLVVPLQMDYAFQFSNRSSFGLADVPRHFVSMSYTY
jgi:hypothetical protein